MSLVLGEHWHSADNEFAPPVKDVLLDFKVVARIVDQSGYRDDARYMPEPRFSVDFHRHGGWVSDQRIYPDVDSALRVVEERFELPRMERT